MFDDEQNGRFDDTFTIDQFLRIIQYEREVEFIINFKYGCHADIDSIQNP